MNSLKLNDVKRNMIRDEALKIKNDEQNRREMLKERQEKSNYDSGAKYLLKLQSSDAPLVGRTQVDADPRLKRLMANMSAKQQQALYDQVEKPKDSSPSAKADMVKLITGQDEEHPNGLRGMSTEDLALKKSGLNKTDQAALDRHYMEQNSETGAQEQARYKNATAKMKEKALAAGIVKPDQFNRITGAQKTKYEALELEFVKAMEARGTGPMSPKDIDEAATGFVVAKATGEAFTPPPRPQAFKAAKTAPAAQEQAAPQSLNDAKMWSRKFFNKYGRAPTPMTYELTNFINHGNKD